MAASNKLLINEHPLQALPTLAKMLDLNKAVILQQIQYWVSTSSHEIEGYHWIYNSYTQWSKQFPWLTPRSVRYHIKELENAGLLIIGEFNTDSRDNTKWYRIDYDRLEAMTISSCGVAGIVTPPCQKSSPPLSKTDTPLPETTQETIPETTTIKPTNVGKDNPSPSNNLVDQIFKAMQAYYGYPDSVKEDPIPNYGKEGKAIKRLLARGFTPRQILESWMEKSKKAGIFKSMVYINEDIKVVSLRQGVSDDPDKYIKGKYGHLVRRS